MFSFLKIKNKPIQQVDHLLTNGTLSESKEDKDHIQSLLLMKDDPIPSINQHTFPELLRTLLLNQEMINAIANLNPDFTLKKIEQRQQELKEYASYSPAFKKWLKTSNAKECLEHFCKDMSTAQLTEIQKQFKKLATPASLIDNLLNNEKKYARKLAMTHLKGSTKYLEIFEKRKILTMEVITILIQKLTPLYFESDKSILSLISGLRTLQENNMLDEANIHYITQVPEKAAENAFVLLNIKRCEIHQANADFLLKNPFSASDISYCFMRLHQAGILDKYRDYLRQNINFIINLTEVILKLDPLNLFDKYQQQIENRLRYWHGCNPSILDIADMLIIFNQCKISEKNITALFRFRECFKNTFIKLKQIGILESYQDLIFDLFKHPQGADRAESLIFLHQHQLLNERTATALANNLHTDEYPNKLFEVLKTLDLLNEENILKFFPNFSAIADALWTLHQHGLLSGEFREPIITAFKKDPKSATIIEMGLTLLEKAAWPTSEYIKYILDKPRFGFFLSDTLIFLKKHDLLDKYHQTILKLYSSHPQYVFSMGRLLTKLNKQKLSEDALSIVLEHPQHAHEILECRKYLKKSNLNDKYFIRMLLDNINHIQIIKAALQALIAGKEKITLKEYLVILEKPKLALNYAEAHQGKFTKYNRGSIDFLEIRQTTKYLAQGANSSFFKIPKALLSNIATMAAGNGHLGEEARNYISYDLLLSKKN